jgi:hypothetical protein
VLSEVSVTGVRAKRESLGDYQLYRLPWPTDLNARQTKQVVFLGNPRVKVERFYGVRLGYFEAPQPDTRGTPELMLRWKNEKSAGLGEPLPAGHIRVFESYVGSEVFAGEAEILDKPVGLPVEIAIARALNLSSEYTHFNNPKFSDGSRIRVESTHHFVNNKELPVSVEVRHAGDSDMTSPVVIRSSLRAGKKNGELAWRFKVPAGGEQWLRYDLESRRIESQEIEED